MKRNLSIIALGLISAIGMSSQAFAAPTITKQQLFYSGDTGILTYRATLAGASKAGCTFRLRTTVSYENVAEVEAIRTSFKRQLKNGKLSLRITNVPAVVTDSEGNLPQLNVQGSYDCGSRGRAVSNAIAVRVVCGTGVEEVTPLTFLRKLQSKLKDALD